MNDTTKYYATPAINMIWALKESVRIIKEEGIENRYLRHSKQAKSVQGALEAIGFRILADKEHRAVTLSNVIYPEGVNDVHFRTILAEEGAMVAGGLGAYAGKMFRLGHMGNIDKHTLISTVAAIERAAVKCGMNIEMGSALKVLQEGLLNL